MSEEHQALGRPKSNFAKQLILCVLIVGVFALSILAFTRPVSQGLGQAESTATLLAPDQTATPTTTILTPTPDSEEMPPTPEEIGYTNGIIIWSTILIIILLVGTLRETIRREGR